MTLRLRQLREDRGMTQTFVAKKIGFPHVSNYHMIEKEKRRLDIITAKKLAELFGVEIEDLFLN